MSRNLDDLRRIDVEFKAIDRKALGDTALTKHGPRFISEPTQLWSNGELVVVYARLAPGELEWIERVDDVEQTITLPDHFDKLPFPYKVGTRTHEGLATQGETFGWMPRRTLRQDYCHRSVMSEKFPDVHHALMEAAQLADDYYERLFPDKYAEHLRLIGESGLKEEYRLRAKPDARQTVFTSGIVNQDSTLAYHVDSGNFKGSWSFQFTWKRGVGGGYLVMPELGVHFEVADRTLLIFNGQAWWHGVTKFSYDPKSGVAYSDSRRYSTVFYSMRQLCNCMTPREEIERIQRIHSQREFRRGLPESKYAKPDEAQQGRLVSE